MNKFIVVLFFIFSIISCSKIEPAKSFLINSNWEFSKAGDSIYYKAAVPGVIHTDLLANNLIEDPLLETNELKLQWIELENWNYKTVVNLTKAQIDHENIEIEFEGLDTYATVFLNGEKIIEATNMFRTWKADIKRLLKVGDNHLEVRFTSPINFNREEVKKFPYKLPSGNETVAEKVSPLTRKAAYQFGWDWGPRFVTSGIWKNVKINTWNKVRIMNVFVQTDSIINNKAYLTYSLSLESQSVDNNRYKINIDNQVISVKLKKGINKFQHKIVVVNPKLWWPNGIGKPNLHKLKVELLQGSTLLDSITQSYGIRTVALVQEKDVIGTSFYFKINGKPLFIKGANYIPQDVFLPRVTGDKYKKLIDKVVTANMNMLRVWGGGIYEKDFFCELCDKYGILVWQDFMFAGSLYPNTEEFLNNVKQEVKENVTRLRKHPSIALWCGNNEIEVAWNNWGWQEQFGYTKTDSIKIWENYKQLFHSTIPEILKKLDSKVNYVNTSPLSNWGTPKNFNYGSMHYWGVWHGHEPFENFKTNVGRFMVEYGFQSYPSIKTIQTFASNTSLVLDSETMKNRQKSYIGNGLITEHINNWFSDSKTFEDFVEKSQKTQAIALQIAIQSHRQQSPHCMGTLFWQLNDCWPGPSWSVLDYFGNKKKAYTTVKENFKPIIAVYDNAKNVIEIISDSTDDYEGELKISLKQKTQSKIILNTPFFIKANSRIKLKVPTINECTKGCTLNILLSDSMKNSLYSTNVLILE
jgi:beta-mannosidase